MIDTKCVFNSKRNGEDCVERFSGRLPGKGFARIFGLDVIGTYTSVAWLGTPRILYALVVLMYLMLGSLDVEAALMNTLLDEELCTLAPPGTEQLPEGPVYRLLMSFYGLNKSPRRWNDFVKCSLSSYQRL